MDLSLRRAAEITHVDYGYLGKVERGTCQPTDVWITAYVRLLGEHAAEREGAA